ncbi:NAD(P)/FAD-dependent oxidoreductase [Oceanicaulis alexandrii]|uniref:NAD(P)/FAD-dependent oxidoreductase n=1 Tax=Oceanicaulis alexandrii TaxID=153233 RepID=UPI0023524E69|nr:FAD-dependent oxidoreductase [Oceanicaulis alexandrii]
MADIVILGAGLGGLPMAFEAREQMRKTDTITVISDSPTFHFTPSNPWVAVGWRDAEQIKIELAPLLKKRGIEFIHAAATKVHPDRDQVELSNGETISYDYLVIATGPKLDFDAIEGLGPHGGHTQSVCHVNHAELAGEDWEKLVADPGPVIVGAVQGASCFGPAYEHVFTLETDLRRKKIRDQVPMTFVTSEPYIGHLGLDGVGDTKGLLEHELRQRSIKFITSARITKVEAGLMHVEEVGRQGEVVETHELPFKHSMVLPAFKGVDAVFGVDGLVNEKGFVLVDRHQQNPNWPKIFSVGVCVAIPPVASYPVPVGVPKTGFMIESMVRAAAKNIRALIEGREMKHESTWNAVCIADFGDGGVAFVAMPQIPPRNVNWAVEGGWVHMAKAAFEGYFMGKMRRGVSEPFYERMMLDLLGITKVRDSKG